MQAANQMIAEKDAFVRKTFHEIRTPCHILLQVTSVVTVAALCTSLACVLCVRARATYASAWRRLLSVASLLDTHQH
jgi:hypothetical protein